MCMYISNCYSDVYKWTIVQILVCKTQQNVINASCQKHVLLIAHYLFALSELVSSFKGSHLAEQSKK